MAKGHKNQTFQGTALKLDNRVWRVYCAECLEPFEASRSDAVYCSGKCRTHAARAPQRLANTLRFLNDLSFTLGNYSRQYKQSKVVFWAFQRLYNILGDQLKNFENVDGQ